MARLTIHAALGFVALVATLSAVAAQDGLQAVLTPGLTPWPKVRALRIESMRGLADQVAGTRLTDASA